MTSTPATGELLRSTTHPAIEANSNGRVCSRTGLSFPGLMRRGSARTTWARTGVSVICATGGQVVEVETPLGIAGRPLFDFHSLFSATGRSLVGKATLGVDANPIERLAHASTTIPSTRRPAISSTGSSSRPAGRGNQHGFEGCGVPADVASRKVQFHVVGRVGMDPDGKDSIFVGLR